MKALRASKTGRIIICYFVMTCMAGGALFGADLVDKIVAVVNEEIITESDIEATLGPLFVQYRSIYRGTELMEKMEEARRRVITDLVNQKVLLSKAKVLEVKVDEKDLEKALQTVKDRFKSEDEFKAALASEGITYTQFRRRQEEKLMVQMLMAQRVAPRVEVSPSEMRRYYESHKDEFSEPEKILLKHILIKSKDKRSPEAALSLAREIAARIAEGGDFSGLAKVYSDGPERDRGGQMDFVKRGILRKEIDDAVFALKPGEVSKIIISPLGCHIFKMEKKVSAVTQEFSDVRSTIQRVIFNQKLQKEVSRWVEDLKKDAYISFR